ncbi:fatty acid oxidation complex subunit alpha FadB [Methylocella tundrae]|uniref:enoyl-CoA hydratase n=1 Tax=Methylocella tundrae TaxID=227605 RepID=A0A4U8Z168_METTU|nr:fatty acid oxidation complex subunit alpha FadB [Methylocella tundrae]WPP06336.1 fatty acid oxidation complex subunit alpha FadB [Methylocella tundrae]VFU09035.1 Enoyl-CoA hydratase/Delta(3)-cis-Delta(2)-trans-enoyl-CoA isomerase/3-hydroxybutyryl-CoA epimerase / 3-hydroxyacyl-CoA dehydrogenase [Methylocella tundrae]
MLFDGETIQVEELGEGLVELRFARKGEAVNKLDRLAFGELARAIGAVSHAPGLKGVLISSGKDAFIVGADIFEFVEIFRREEKEIADFVAANAKIITALSDLPAPSVAAINGLALGGGFEVALAADYRVMSSAAKIGQPEVHLGIFPGYGGTVRLPRLIGLAESAQWIISGAQQTPEAALARGAVDAVASPEDLREAALTQLRNAVANPAEWRRRRVDAAKALSFEGQNVHDFLAGAEVNAARALPHYPAAHDAVELLELAAGLDRDAALALEAEQFARTARSQAAASLINIFINEQALKKIIKQYAKSAAPVRRAAVIGAGVMGAGIAYQSALRGVPTILKDVSDKALDAGMAEAQKLLAKQVEQGRLSLDRADAIAAAITPSLTFDGFGSVDVVIEAIVENIDIKAAVFRQIEGIASAETILASNTSSLRIADLADGLRHPENFIGMHFFNPVPKMALVEVVRGPKTSEAAVATIVGYANALGKTPIVVGDCPGFVVNRVLTPYLIAFLHLVRDGVDFHHIDRVMEGFGWPMGPAYLIDVIGLDISHHVVEIVSAGFPERMAASHPSAIDILKADGRLGQKNGRGFYLYTRDPKGRPRKDSDPAAPELLAAGQPRGKTTITDAEIIERMMLPLILETARCFEDGVVGSPGEADMCLLLGLGLPRYLGGALKYADYLGLQNIVERSVKWRSLGEIYRPSEKFSARAAAGKGFYEG